MKALLLTFGIVFLAFLLPLLLELFESYRKLSGTRLVTCPETGGTAFVELDAARGALAEIFGNGQVRIRSCARWQPGRRNCGEGCCQRLKASLAPSVQEERC
jgi:hypothetical protein